MAVCGAVGEVRVSMHLWNDNVESERTTREDLACIAVAENVDLIVLKVSIGFFGG